MPRYEVSAISFVNMTTSVLPLTSYSYTGPWTLGNWAGTTGWAPCIAGGGGSGFDHHSETAPDSTGMGSGGQDTFTYNDVTCSSDSGERDNYEGVHSSSFSAWKSGSSSYTVKIQWTLSIEAGFLVMSQITPCQGSAWIKARVYWAMWDSNTSSDVAGNVYTSVFDFPSTSSIYAYCANMEVATNFNGIQGYLGQYYQFNASSWAVANGVGDSVTLAHGNWYIPRLAVDYTDYVDCDNPSDCAGAEGEGSFVIASPSMTIT